MRLIATRDVFRPGVCLSLLHVTFDGPMAFGVGGWKEGNPRGPLLFGYFLEDEDRGLHVVPSLALPGAVKVRGKTAIPATEGGADYALKRTWSNRFHKLTADGKAIQVLDVPGYDGVRTHPGNTPADTDGCPLPGTMRDIAKGMVLHSKNAWEWLERRVTECEARGEAVTLAVLRDQVAWAAYLGQQSAR